MWVVLKEKLIFIYLNIYLYVLYNTIAQINLYYKSIVKFYF